MRGFQSHIKFSFLLWILFPLFGAQWRKKIIQWMILAIGVIAGRHGVCQDPQFSQFYASPLYLNPAMTGNTQQGRIAAIYRNQWAAVPASAADAFKSYAFSYDHNILKISSGVGLQFVRDRAGTGGLRFTDIAGLYAYHLTITRNLHLNAGMRFGYTTRDIDFTRLTFGDQLLRNDGSATNEVFVTNKISYFDVGSGIILYAPRFWFGTAFNHINEPNQSFTGTEAPLPMKYSAHGGVNIPVKKNAKGIAISNVTIAANFKRSPVILGMWYRGIPVLKSYQPGYLNNDAIICLAGFSFDDYGISFGYSYDITISRLVKNTAGSHEISLIYEYVTPYYKKSKRKFVIPCTKF
jgi:type IX secretion system PorP/SprF family membrane protein